MKSILYFAVLLTLISCQRNINLRITEITETATVVKGNRFEGVIFSETMELDTVYEKRFTPTVAEIELAETVLRRKIKALDMQDEKFTRRGCPIITKNLNKYTRQYGGFIDKNGQKIILINCIFTQSTFLANRYFGNHKIPIEKDILKSEWTNNYCSYSVCGYCSKFWNVKVDLDKQRLFEWHINHRIHFRYF